MMPTTTATASVMKMANVRLVTLNRKVICVCAPWASTAAITRSPLRLLLVSTFKVSPSMAAVSLTS